MNDVLRPLRLSRTSAIANIRRRVVVPLSEHEQRVLDQLENAMAAEDPKFATAMRGSSRQARARRRLLFGGLGLLLGLVLVLLGVAGSQVPIAVLGFLLMIAAGAFAATPPRRPRGPVGSVDAEGRTRARAPRAKSAKAKSSRGKSARSSDSLMQRLERRWEQRRDDNRGWGG
jgi:Protein of unknown function (DUF3040)